MASDVEPHSKPDPTSWHREAMGALVPDSVERDRDRPDASPSWQQLVAAAATAAGGAAWISAIGSAIVGLRLDSAGLPVESTVALMSAEHRFVIGIGFLIGPLFVGLLAFLCEWAVLAKWPHSIGDGTRLVLAAGAIAVAAAFGLLVLKPSPPELFLVQCAIVLVAVPLAFVILGRVHERRRGRVAGGVLGRPKAYWHRLDEFLVLFVAVLVTASVIALIWVARSEATFDTAAVALKDGEVVGKYVTTTENAVVLITKGPDGCWGIGAVPRDQIVQIRIGPGADTVEMDPGCTD